jgi:hypothetical protein
MIDLSQAARFVLGQPVNPLHRVVYKLKRSNCFSRNMDPCFHDHIGELRDLEHLRIGSKKPVSSRSVAAMSLLPHLKDLDLSGSIMSDNGICKLSGFTALTSLQLERCGRFRPHAMKVRASSFCGITHRTAPHRRTHQRASAHVCKLASLEFYGLSRATLLKLPLPPVSISRLFATFRVNDHRFPHDTPSQLCEISPL